MSNQILSRDERDELAPKVKEIAAAFAAAEKNGLRVRHYPMHGRMPGGGTDIDRDLLPPRQREIVPESCGNARQAGLCAEEAARCYEWLIDSETEGSPTPIEHDKIIEAARKLS